MPGRMMVPVLFRRSNGLDVFGYHLEVDSLLPEQSHRIEHAKPSCQLRKKATFDNDHLHVEATQSSVRGAYELPRPPHTTLIQPSTPEQAQRDHPAAPSQLLNRLYDPVYTATNTTAILTRTEEE